MKPELVTMKYRSVARLYKDLGEAMSDHNKATMWCRDYQCRHDGPGEARERRALAMHERTITELRALLDGFDTTGEAI